ncbi:MAG: tRNA 4-thiouridine(8) synthase ThiI [Clostridiales bacterium]|nr:tRNA 4-thiouridine(8) synthase ThiI [Clostridiales bacterium]
MKEIILLKNGELALKGLNRRTFEDILIKNMKHRLSSLGKWTFTPSQSTIMAAPENEDVDFDEAINRISKVFGIAAFSRALEVPKDMAVILDTVGTYLEPELIGIRTFKVEAKRSDKKFPLKSPEICSAVGEKLLEQFPHLTVDVHDPDITVMVEIRDKFAYIHGTQLKGAGGMPSGSAGNAALLISGGIDSPVAGYMMAKRGLRLTAIHFASPPYTSERAEMKVHSLLRQVAKYSGIINLFVVPFTEIQEQILDNCPEDLFTIIMRRFMMKCAEIIAAERDCAALITGESVGQVASQTLYALACTDRAVDMPVFRPLIGMDKSEVIAISRKIEAFDISILPYEDCCTVFTPKHPRTHPKLEAVLKAEEALNAEELISKAVENKRLVIINP